jgi:repressor LexA
MPSSDLTETQARVCRFIEDWVISRGYPPTVREIAKGLKYKSPNAVRQHLRLIQQKGFLEVASKKARGIRIKTQRLDSVHGSSRDVPLVGRIAAGTPIVAEENLEGMITIDADLFRGAGLFGLRVRGDSMKGIGVLDGDIAIVKQQPAADDGEVVAAVIGEEATLKRFFRKKGRIVLRAENPAFRDIIIDPAENVSVAGKLVGVIRTRITGMNVGFP